MIGRQTDTDTETDTDTATKKAAPSTALYVVAQGRGSIVRLLRQKRPTMEAKETYYRGKRDLLWRQKRPTKEAKERPSR